MNVVGHFAAGTDYCLDRTDNTGRRDAARRTVAALAKDAADARLLLDMLGLLEDQ